ncbi:MAG: Tol-Pal system beta propeller repeat protein TolB [Rickettsiales bacterium]|nr:Tol-Pal system beta propeller repeat protein TolB [Rickettsiales bacterium]
MYLNKILLLLFFISNLNSKPLEINVTDGKIEPIPIAVTKFNYSDAKEKELSNKIFEIIQSNLLNSGLFNSISNKAFLQDEKEVFVQPLFKDWSLIDANLIVSGEIRNEKNMITIRLKLWDVYREKLILSKRISNINDKRWRLLAHLVSNMIYERVTGEQGYFDTKIVYIAEEGSFDRKKKRIAIMDYDGNNHRFLTDGQNLVLTPRFSPDRKNIVYLSYDNNKPNVYLMDIRSREKKKIGKFQGMSYAPRFSPKGNKIIFSLTKKGSSNIFVLDLLNNNTSQLTNNKYINTSPCFSPDSKNVVFSSDRAGKQNLYIFSMNKRGNPVKRISFGRGNYATPVWSPRGDYIAFTKSLGKRFYIGLIKPDGSGERIISEGYLVEGPSWSPNGRTLTFYKINKRNNIKESKLYTIDITGNLEKILSTPYEASDPDWGPTIGY